MEFLKLAVSREQMVHEEFVICKRFVDVCCNSFDLFVGNTDFKKISNAGKFVITKLICRSYK